MDRLGDGQGSLVVAQEPIRLLKMRRYRIVQERLDAAFRQMSLQSVPGRGPDNEEMPHVVATCGDARQGER